MRTICVLLALGILLPGCAVKPAASNAAPTEPAGAAPPPPTTVAGTPVWETGRFWRITMQVGFADLGELKGALVVAPSEGDKGYVGSDAINISVFDRYFDNVFVGPVDRELNPTVQKETVRLFQWPMVPNATWTTRFPSPDIERGESRLVNATLRVVALEDVDPWKRVRIVGTTTAHEAVDYDLDYATGWFTYFRVTNETTGKVLLSVDVEGAGTGFRGTVHKLVLTTLKERFAILPPCDPELTCYPEATGVPPLEPVTVPAGFTWVDEIAFLFTFPIMVGAGVASFEFVHPDGSVDRDTHKGAGENYEFTFRRYEVRQNTAGQWAIGVHAVGLAGVFAGLYGVKDEALVL